MKSGILPAETQTRLLRVLSDGKFYRVGGHEPRTANVRIIAATHQDPAVAGCGKTGLEKIYFIDSM